MWALPLQTEGPTLTPQMLAVRKKVHVVSLGLLTVISSLLGCTRRSARFYTESNCAIFTNSSRTFPLNDSQYPLLHTIPRSTGNVLTPSLLSRSRAAVATDSPRSSSQRGAPLITPLTARRDVTISS
jgi:hypothetical protein